MWADEDAVQPGRLAFGFRLQVEPDVTHETQEVWAEYSRAEQIGDDQHLPRSSLSECSLCFRPGI
jgi:hypothetical protein